MSSTIETFENVVDARVIIRRDELLDDGGMNDRVIKSKSVARIERVVGFANKLGLDPGQSKDAAGLVIGMGIEILVVKK